MISPLVYLLSYSLICVLTNPYVISPSRIHYIHRLYAIKRLFPTKFSEVKSIKSGNMVEYVSAKGSKSVALVNQREGAHLKVMNDAKKIFSIPFSRLTYHIDGNYQFGDLLRLDELLLDLKQNMVERVWEKTYAYSSSSNQKSTAIKIYNFEEISSLIWGVKDPVHVFAAHRIMSLYGSIYFADYSSTIPFITCSTENVSKNSSSNKVVENDITESHTDTSVHEILFYPLAPGTVQDNLKTLSALRDFKNRFQIAVMSPSNRRSPIPQILTDLPDRVLRVTSRYEDYLFQYIAESHPWVHQGWSRRLLNDSHITKAKEFLELLDLLPSVKNAKKVLEMMGVYNPHYNMEKYVMDIRDNFPADVLAEAEFLLDNFQSIPDPDERIRVDLRHLRTYAVDKEGATEIDDALSVEATEAGLKIWIHIADVSRWIRPGSLLSIEAERRMATVYMPDEKISMFPETLSTDLISLGAKADSYAISLGLYLTAEGEVRSYELCPSKIRVTRRLSYTQLDKILNKSLNFPNYVAVDQYNVDLIESSTDNNLRISHPIPEFATSTSNDYESNVFNDLSVLNQIAKCRHELRIQRGSLDYIMRHKTELALNIKRDIKNPRNVVVNGYTSWSNGTSLSMVAELMILMSDTIGGWCVKYGAPVWYKVQLTEPPLTPKDIEAQPGEVSFVRAARILKNLRGAQDSKVPGLHCTSGSTAYVQCTSPIRRYLDLYNHYRLKGAMHAASLGEEWVGRAKAEAGIELLDSMATPEQMLSTLNAIKLVTRQRDQYWLTLYISKLIAAQAVFDCLVFGISTDGLPATANTGSISSLTNTESSTPYISNTSNITSSKIMNNIPIYEALILQLGSHYRHRLYSNRLLISGDVLKCKLYKFQTISPTVDTYLLVPVDIPFQDIPDYITSQLFGDFPSPSPVSSPTVL